MRGHRLESFFSEVFHAFQETGSCTCPDRRHHWLYHQPLYRVNPRPPRAPGALAGAATGAAVGRSPPARATAKGILTGVAAGAALGGGIGYYMDVREAKLREKLQGTGVSVTRNGDQLILNMPNNVTFDSSSAQLKAAGANTLSGVAPGGCRVRQDPSERGRSHRQHRLPRAEHEALRIAPMPSPPS